MDLPAQQPPHVITVDDTLVLRRFEGEADLPELHRVIDESLDHLRPWLDWAADHSPARTAEFLAARDERWEAGEEFAYAVVLDGALVGACGLYRHEDTPADAFEIGYWLHPAATGRGVAVRAARALTGVGFRLPGVEQLLVVHEPGNHASAAIPPRLGFTERAPLHDGGTEFRVWGLDRTP
ncbi:GNAT family N-acetyltransferase [Streptomyces sp. NRRL S-87]|uniref:GNAT family N-acetyltransferase n=1 Tax=Streptomyces sp. NRRL S-87 TaxID=1463920 RepID=UPI00068EB64A|nr:GNAT family N-acetyltransferase [Streptomyces sp. NRRL S-87]